MAKIQKPSQGQGNSDAASNTNGDFDDAPDDITAKYERERIQLLEEYEENELK